MIALLLSLAAFSPSAQDSQDTTNAYLNADARELVRLARLRRNTVDRRIESYSTTARERFSIGLRLGIAEKLAYRRETVTRIDWERDGPVRMDVLAMREFSPLLKTGADVPDDMSAELFGLTFDPMNSEMLLRVDTTEIRHPLREGSETQYRFEAGDTTVISLPDGRSVRLRELRIIPRRLDPTLIEGSFLLDTETHAVVQAYFKPARALTDQDMNIDADNRAVELAVDAFASIVLKPMRAEAEFIAVEYGLMELEWWLPRRLAAKGYVQVNRFRIPMSYERTYEAYTVRGDTSGGRVPRPDSLPLRCDARVRFTASGDPVRDSIRQARTDSVWAWRERYRERRRAERAERGDSVTTRRCIREFIIAAPGDSALLHSSELPADLYAADTKLMSDDELRAIVARVRRIAGVASRFQSPQLQWALRGPGLLRYNRVEGLSLGARIVTGLGPVDLETEARIGLADRDPRFELALDRRGDVLHSRLAAYRRLQSTTASAGVHGTFATFGALFFGRDDEEWFDATGGELVVRPPDARAQWYDLRLYAERQRAVERNTHFSLAHTIDSNNTFRENFAADDAEQFGARIGLRAGFGLNPASPRIAGEVTLGGEIGDYDILRPEALVRVSTPLPLGLALGLEGSLGTVEGSDIPAQALWRLGGATTLRGYPGNAIAGERYWRARSELGWGVQAARLTLFSDAAWAGPRNRFDSNGTLLSAGAGVSFLDGVFRLDLARGFKAPGGWRMHVHFNGVL
jgi:hypothetical protein